MRWIVLATWLWLAAWPTWSSAGVADEIRSGLEQQQSVRLTIYNDDLALVEDVRELELAQGRHVLAFREVSARIQPETALFTGPGLTVLEQNFEYDLLTPSALLHKFVGREVEVVKTHPTTGEEWRERARILSDNDGVVLRIGDRIETGVPGRLVFTDLPPDLRDRPTLTMSVDVAAPGRRRVVLSYLTTGLGWRADYVAELRRDETALALRGWVTLHNRSGVTYRRATLQLVAGEVHRAQPEQERLLERRRLPMAAKAAPAMQEESLFEYHLYTLARPTTIRHNQTKQVALLQADQVRCAKRLILQGDQFVFLSRRGEIGRKLPVGVYLALENREDDGLGLPLPAGVVRVYQRDRRGRLQFVGEDAIEHTPKGERLLLHLGRSFDVTAAKVQTDFRKVAGSGPYDYVYESAYRIELRNGKETPARVEVREPMPGDWTILEASHPHRKASARLALWEVDVPPRGKTVLEYRVRVRH